MADAWLLAQVRAARDWRRGGMMNRDEIDGKTDQLKGKVKQAVGDLTDNERLHGEGTADEVAGDVKEGFGRGRRKVGEAIEDLGDKLKK
jgi:uncharacterized protein YjbJ (UPF0337 family)